MNKHLKHILNNIIEKRRAACHSTTTKVRLFIHFYTLYFPTESFFSCEWHTIHTPLPDTQNTLFVYGFLNTTYIWYYYTFYFLEYNIFYSVPPKQKTKSVSREIRLRQDAYSVKYFKSEWVEPTFFVYYLVDRDGRFLSIFILNLSQFCARSELVKKFKKLNNTIFILNQKKNKRYKKKLNMRLLWQNRKKN